MQYGIDVAAVRFDDLDGRLFDYLKTTKNAHVLELGAGSGRLASQLALRGATITAADIEDTFKREYVSAPNMKVVVADALQFIREHTDASYAIVVMQRVLHYYPYSEARQLLKLLHARTSGKLFLSVSGVETAIAEYHPAPRAPLYERSRTLHPNGQALFSISVPICLYTKAELQHLLFTSDWKIDHIWTSAFGNHKVIATPGTW